MKKELLPYLLIAFGVCWLGAALIPAFGLEYGSVTSTVIVALICMPAPALAAFIAQKYILKRPFSDLQLTWKHAVKKGLFLTPLWLLLWAFFFYVLIAVFGNLLHFEAFGEVHFTQDQLLLKIEEMTKGQVDLSTLNLPSWPALLLLIFVAGIIAGCTINLPFTLGEEIGWRGFMFHYLRDSSMLVRVLITGFFWGIWHAPIIWMGHNYPEHPHEGVLVMILFCIAISFPMDFIRRQSKSVLGPGIFHGMINASATGMMLFIANGNDLFASIAGISGCIAAFAVYLIQASFFKPKTV